MRKNTILATKIIRARNGLLLLITVFIILAALTVPRTSLTDWDEGVFALQSRWFSTLGQQGKPYNFQTPPLFQLTAAAISRVFDSHACALKWLSVFLSCMTVIAVFRLVKQLHSESVAVYSAFILMTCEYFLFFSRSGLSDATFVCFSTLAVLLFIKAIKHGRLLDCILASVFIILALYTKYSGVALIPILFFLGLLHRKRLHRSWFAVTIVLPAVCFLPFALVYFWVVGLSEMHGRHAPLVGIHHLKYLYYLLILAPIPFFLTALHAFRARKKFLTSPLFFVIIAFFFIVGFYYPFFRLLYPLIPLCAITAACSLDEFRRFKPYVLIGIALSVLLSFRTITYTTDIPERIAVQANHFARDDDIRYVYSSVPPNVLYYLGGDILIPAGHPWIAIGRKIPRLIRKRTIMYPDSVLLEPGQDVLFVHATTVDSVKQTHDALFESAVLVSSLEFIDAPVYYKDRFNVQRDVPQVYEVYLFRNEKLGERMKELWSVAFLRGIDVLSMY